MNQRAPKCGLSPSETIPYATWTRHSAPSHTSESRTRQRQRQNSIQQLESPKSDATRAVSSAPMLFRPPARISSRPLLCGHPQSLSCALSLSHTKHAVSRAPHPISDRSHVHRAKHSNSSERVRKPIERRLVRANAAAGEHRCEDGMRSGQWREREACVPAPCAHRIAVRLALARDGRAVLHSVARVCPAPPPSPSLAAQADGRCGVLCVTHPRCCRQRC